MKFEIFHDGQFFIGLVCYVENNQTRYVKHTFGTEPNTEAILEFIHKDMLGLLEQLKVEVATKPAKNRINPKRQQRKIAKEQKKRKSTTFAQEVLKKEKEIKKKESKKKNKKIKEFEKERKRQIKRKKAKEKHKGH